MTKPHPIRWWPGIAIAILGAIAITTIHALDVWPYEQARSLATIATVAGTVLLLLLWWLIFSRATWRARLMPLVVVALIPVFFRYRGMTGDFVPLFEFRFAKSAASSAGGGKSAMAARADFPQAFGPKRDARLDGPSLDPDWKNHPPQVLWRQSVGAAWSGFAIVGDRALTLEQHGEEELVTCRDVLTGKLLWSAASAGHFNNSVAGEGPRTTPTVLGDRVYTLGATGSLRCLELATGKPIWMRDLLRDAGVEVPMFGFSSSPLLHDGKVIISAGIGTTDGKPKPGAPASSLLAYDATTGEPVWRGGSRPVNYSSPFLLTLAGMPQIVMFNTEAITAHDPATGAVLWEHLWGKGMPHVARPIPVGENRILFSSGYGVGSALLEITRGADGKFAATEVWKTIRYQAKFSNPVERGGLVYGVSDGIFACLDLKDGNVRWKDGRYGHGQGLLIGEHYLQMSEIPGALVLLRPMPDGANELGRFRVFDEKTWNPLALSGDLLLVRNDREAACIRLPLAKPAP